MSYPTHSQESQPAHARPTHAETITLKPCQDGHAEHHLIAVDAAVTAALGLPDGSLLHLDTRRSPTSGDVVLAEVLVRERLVRTVRRYSSVGPPGGGGTVSLAPLADTRAGPPAAQAVNLIRPRYEIGVIGVVDGHVAPLDKR